MLYPLKFSSLISKPQTTIAKPRFALAQVAIPLCCVLFLNTNTAMAQKETYQTPPESIVDETIPQGRIDGPHTFQSDLFPGTSRKYWVYVPAQYDASNPACLMVLQDGYNRAKSWKLPTILDHLIHRGEIPVQLAVFVDPGVVPAASPSAKARYNRSYEYDGLGDRYSKFLLEELLPEISKKYTFSEDPNDRLIGGSSSGAICAFTVAWERPDSFSRVLSSIGTYVGLRGGNEYPTLIRKTEPKPIRIFLQDGNQDLDIYGGSWWHANQSMLSALQFSGYDVKHAWGQGGHDGKHTSAILPDALRWLWADYPETVKNVAGKKRRTDLLIPGEDWERISSGHRFTEGPAFNDAGEFYFTDIPNHRIHKVDTQGNVSVFAENTHRSNGLMFGPDGKLYACEAGKSRIVRYLVGDDKSSDSKDGPTKEVFLSGVKANDIVILHDGSGYLTEQASKKVWRFSPQGELSVVDEGIRSPNGIIVSPDQTLLTVSDTEGRFCYSFCIGPNGQLTHRQEFGWLHVTDRLESNADGMAVDTQGRTYVTTKLGLQVLDQAGRVHLIIRSPQDAWLSNVVFGGVNQDVLYVTCGNSVYRRKINATGVHPRKKPIAPPKPRL